LNKLLPLIAFSVLLLGAFGMPNAFAGGLDEEDIIFTKEVDKSLISPGELVTYTYRIQNLDDFNQDTCTITDNILGLIADNVSVGPLEVHVFVKSTNLDETTTNIASVDCGRFVSTASAIVTVSPVGGELIPIETTSLILAGAQTFSWMIPIVLSVLGIGLFVVSRKSENS